MKKLFIIIIAIGMLFSCSEKRDIADVKVGPHPEGWVEENAAGEHGEYLEENGFNLNSCKSCHGEDFTGGSSGVSCYSCHELFPHPEGFAEEDSTLFHAKFVKTINWDIQKCTPCHGENYEEEMNGVSCRTCHTQTDGPLTCTTCHGTFGMEVTVKDTFYVAPPEDLEDDTASSSAGVGAHQHHLAESEYAKPFPCESCHQVPENVFDENHMDPLPADITFSALASDSGNVNPIWNHQSLTCENVYCHGNFTFYKDSSSNTFGYADSVITGNNPTIQWNLTDGSQIQCGTCHDLPPKGHIALTSCGSCHSGYDPDQNQVNLDKHINGKIDVFY